MPIEDAEAGIEVASYWAEFNATSSHACTLVGTITRGRLITEVQQLGFCRATAVQFTCDSSCNQAASLITRKQHSLIKSSILVYII